MRLRVHEEFAGTCPRLEANCGDDRDAGGRVVVVACLLVPENAARGRPRRKPALLLGVLRVDPTVVCVRNPVDRLDEVMSLVGRLEGQVGAVAGQFQERIERAGRRPP